MGNHHIKLTAQERDMIAVWIGGRVKLREIARRLGRSVSTISDEVKRNNYQGNYVAIHAQSVTDERKIKARKRHPLKDEATYAYVLKKLGCGWSPEEIAGRLKRRNKETVICHETIYQFIYAEENKEKKLFEYLPRKQKKRKKQSGRRVHKSRIPDRVS
ncbi:MAG: IS30 family transposase, partial [Nanoarchaeota archaeon]